MLWFAALLLVQSVPQQQCTAMDANLPATLAAWATPGHGSPGDFTKPVVLLSRPKGEITGLPASAKDGGATGIEFTVTRPGIYGVAIDQGAWIDMVPDGGAALASVKHGHGPQCSTIHKVVRFDLKPGTYTIYVSGLTSVNVKLFVVEGDAP
jgi:hypothetical protein